jgi:hypothetical protein
VRHPTDHRVARRTLTPAATAPLVRFDDPAGKDRTIRFEPLTGDFEAEHVEPAERGQVRASEGSVKHVEVFRMAGVGTSILGRPRPLPGHRRADHHYTLNCEEPPTSASPMRSRICPCDNTIFAP